MEQGPQGVRIALVLTVVLASLLSASPFLKAAGAEAAGTVERGTVFASGDGVFYRLPSIIVTKQGSVLAACQKRKGGSGDWAESALVLKRSRDGGRTWGPEQTLWESPGCCVFNGNLVEDRLTGTVFALFISFPRADGPRWFPEKWIPAGGGFALVASRDEGETWSAPVEHVPSPNRDGWRGGAAFNNNHGVQLQHADHAGRLVVAARVFKKGVCEDRAKGGLVYSDDHGTTWRVGLAGFPGDGAVNGEVALCETAGGEVYVNYRNRDRGGRRLYSRSRDGGATSYEEGPQNDLPAHGCNAGLLQCGLPGSGDSLLVFTYPLQPDRRQLACRTSRDGGRSWGAPLIIADDGGYSDVAALPDGTLLVLYEKTRTAGLALARIPLDHVIARQ